MAAEGTAGDKAKKKRSTSRKRKPSTKTSAPAEAKVAEEREKSNAAEAKPKAAAKKKKSASRRPAKRDPAMLSKEFLFELAATIKEAVAPLVHDLKGREIVGTAITGDPTFEIDRVAEKALLNFLERARAPIAYYSEDSGYSTFSNEQPKNLLVVDPVDGTRAAKNGYEGCVVAIATTRVIERPTMGDLNAALLMEIVGDRTFYAERGNGARIYQGKSVRRPKLAEQVDLESLVWSMTVPGRPAELIFNTAHPLIDVSSLKGGFFACNSTSYSISRLLTGQLDACVDIAGRYMRDMPDIVRDRFINAGRGAVLGIAPYDIAAAYLVAAEAGCTITDAYGKNFDDVLLLDTSEGNLQSMIAATNPTLHEKLREYFDKRTRQYEKALRRRAQAGG